MKRVKLAAAISSALLLLLALGAWALARSSTPAVPTGRDLESEDPRALREIIRQIGDPRDLPEGELVTLHLDAAQVSALVAEASARRPRVSARAEIHEGTVDVTVSAESPLRIATPYVNLYLTLSGPPNDLVVQAASIGSLPIPAFLGRVFVERARRIAEEREPLVGVAANVVESVTYEEGSVTLSVRWTAEVRAQFLEAGRSMVIGDLGTGRLLHYVDVLRRALVESEGEGDERQLVELLTPMAASARARAGQGEDLRLEFEAAILILTTYSLHMPLSQILSGEAPEELPRHVVLLHERDDLPRHFLVSAATAIFADRPIADALGLAKEMRDAEDADGSGFSFRDLSADRAGVRLAEVSTSPTQLQAVVARLASRMNDADLIPAAEELPEGMDAAAFAHAYQDTQSAAYRALVTRIDAQIEETAVMRAARR